jgi:preprotein translocase subunit SecG
VSSILDISLIITSIMLIVLVILQSRGAGLGGLTGGGDVGSVFTARRGIEKVMFYLTIIFSVLFFILAIVSVMLK